MISPQLFAAQLAKCVCGITLVSATQVQVAHHFNVRRVRLAEGSVRPCRDHAGAAA